jgi:hypothetical protein
MPLSCRGCQPKVTRPWGAAGSPWPSGAGGGGAGTDPGRDPHSLRKPSRPEVTLSARPWPGRIPCGGMRDQSQKSQQSQSQTLRARKPTSHSYPGGAGVLLVPMEVWAARQFAGIRTRSGKPSPPDNRGPDLRPLSQLLKWPCSCDCDPQGKGCGECDAWAEVESRNP